MAYRSNNLLKPLNGYTAFATGYRVIVYDIGGVASGVNAGATINLDAGHGFAVGEKFLLNPHLGASSVYSGTDTVQSITSTTIVMGVSGYSISKGNVLINLGPDTGVTAPNYDASTIQVYSDVDEGDAISNSDITVGTNAFYEYWVTGVTPWELYLDSNGVAAGHGKYVI